MFGYIYLIVNNVNGKMYVGQHKSNNFNDNYKGSGKLLWKAYGKYGEENFDKLFIESCESREQLNEREIFWIAEYKRRGYTLYNLDKGGYRNYNTSKASNSLKDYWTDERRAEWSKRMKCVASKRNNKHTEESKRKMSEAHKGRKWFNNGKVQVHAFECPDGFVSGMLPKKSHPCSEETKRKISAAQKGVKRPGFRNSSTWSKGNTPWNKGKQMSDETKAKLAEANKGKHHTEETRKKMSETRKGKRKNMSKTHWKLVDGKRIWY